MAAITAHHKIRMNLHPAPVVLRHNPLMYSPSHLTSSFVLHKQLKRGKSVFFSREKVEKVPLRHKHHEFAGRWQMAKIGYIEQEIFDDHSERLRSWPGSAIGPMGCQLSRRNTDAAAPASDTPSRAGRCQ